MYTSEANVGLMTEQEKRKFFEQLLEIRAQIIANSPNEDSPLSFRERDILRALANGKSRARIAKEFYISMETVKSHIQKAYSKLQVHSQEQAIKIASELCYI